MSNALFSKKIVFIVMFLGLLTLSSYVFILPTQDVSATPTTISELAQSPEKFEGMLVEVVGEVVDWKEKVYTVSVTSGEITSRNSFKRDYLVIQDPTTSAIIYVRLYHPYLNIDVPNDFVSIGQEITVIGLSRNIEVSIEDWDFNQVIFAKELTNEIGETLELVNRDNLRPFMKHRFINLSDEAESIVGEVITYETMEFNITITSDNFFKSELVYRDILLIQEETTGNMIVVKTNFHRLNISLPEDFIAVGDIITVYGVKNDVSVEDLRIESFIGELDQVLVAFSVTDDSGNTIELINSQCLNRGGNFGTGERRGRFSRSPKMFRP